MGRYELVRHHWAGVSTVVALAAICLGCKIYGLLLRRGWIGADPGIEVCADGSCEPQPARSSGRLGVTGLALSVGALLLAAAPAVAGSLDTRPVRSWSVLKVKQHALVQVAGATQRGGLLSKTVDVGPAAFILEPVLGPAQAVASVLSTADGHDYHVLAQAPVRNLFDPQSAEGSVTHLSQFQTYRKRSGEASLRITISRIALQAVDDNGLESSLDCDSPGACLPIEARVLFHLSAYTSGRTGREFFAGGGTAYFQGSTDEGWDFRAATAADANVAQWSLDDFSHTTGGGGFRNQRRAQMILKAPRTLEVPLSSVPTGRRFTVDVSLEAEATDARGRESAVEAFIEDPQHRDPPLLRPHGLQALPTPSLKEPAVKPPAAAQCSGGASRSAGAIQLSQSTFSAGEGDGTALVFVTRTGGSHGTASVDLDTTPGSAKPGSDFTSTSTRVRFENRDASPRFVEIPIHQDATTESAEKLGVSLSHVRCAKLGTRRSATVTIHDDDQPPPPPPAEFTIGGTVDGLQGSGLVLTNLGTALPVAANGSFTFPGTASDGQAYRVNVNTQPHNPDQVCTVQNGVGQVSNANVTNIAVHCQTTVIPSGLDTTFGDNGHVTTPGQGDGRAVLIQPDGRIIVVGRREVGILAELQFGAAGYDAAGNLDPGFGANGIVTTNLAGSAEEANDAALLPDGGFVAVGQADPAGLANIDFGLVRYTPDGHPDAAFGTGGVVTTDLTGHDDAANAVALQPDGKIVVGGLAEPSPSNQDFALARYNRDGTLDSSFGHGGIVTTDLGTFDDDIFDIALQPDGKIVAVGLTDQGAALARYLPDGRLDPTFGNAGTVIGGLGTDQFNGIAVTPAGTILLAGGGPTGAIVASYGPTGKLNLGFGTLGIAQADLGSASEGDDLVVKADGDIVLVGSAASATGSDMALVRFKPDGTVAASLTADVSGFSDDGNALAIDAQGRIVAAGTAHGQFGLLRANL